MGAAAVLLVVIALAVPLGLLRASLPRLDGELREAGLKAPVRISRDALGVPTIEAANRFDLAYGTGFVHGQDRFFQMDLSRRLAAGELAELFGQVAVDQDRRTRLFRLRSVAREVLAGASEPQRALLEAYARGVNAGRASLRSRPWEYWVLGAPPAAWQPEDTVLVTYAMWWDLQSEDWGYERLRQEVNARLGGPECSGGWKCALGFLYPERTEWDAPVGTEAPFAPAALPPPEALNVRDAHPAPAAHSARAAHASAEADSRAGSNNWALTGRLTATGAAMVANDMHLTLRVPAVWYRARLRVTGMGAGPTALDLIGATLPGAPLLVVGSNTHIAWGFTNSAGNWMSVTRLPCTAVGADDLTTASGRLALAVARERIHVKGGADAELEVKSGPAGVLWQADPQRQSCWFIGWLAQQPEATNLNLMGLEQAATAADALALAPEVGIPHENFVVGDRDGHIGWSIFGRIPNATGPERALGRIEWTTAANQPRLLDPPRGRIWTANARVSVDGRELALIGGSDAQHGANYVLGARAHQIRGDLFALPGNLKPIDMLHVQLDDRALFLARWRELLLHLIDDASLRAHPGRAEFRRLVEAWDAHAGVDSVGYRLVRSFRDQTLEAAWDMIIDALGIPPEDDVGPPAQFESPLWQMVSRQPQHLLAREYADWPAFLNAELDTVIAALGHECPELAKCTWGKRHVVRVRHPLSGALSALAGLLDMPALELPGDAHMPRVQQVAFGASERFAVSPGHEQEGYFLLPGGQSGHPLSPYYRSGFLAWAHGEPQPFLPGPTQHTLTLKPN
ncbi:MAG TPA: penicillin acylase family protein [Steroidobacteraceae bacterium]|nr:penicillin acylase family protein [Steroidobacteraceae bacterium]